MIHGTSPLVWFVTFETVIEATIQAKEPKPKAAPRGKLGHRIPRNANNTATEATPKPAAKRRRVQRNAPPFTDPFRIAAEDRTKVADTFDLYAKYGSTL